MKFLANMGISPKTVEFLNSLGHNALRLSEAGLERAEDVDVISYAAIRKQTILTFDLDYPMLLVLDPGRRTSAIVFRTAKAEPDWINSRLAECLPLVEDPLQAGAIVIVEDHRLRVPGFADL